MKNKQGISLIVLIITIIVMIILAGAIILTLNNSGIIGKSSEAVEKSNEMTIKQIAELGWAEAYAKAIEEGVSPNSSQMKATLEEGVNNALAKNNIVEEEREKYEITITTSGVTVKRLIGIDELERTYNFVYYSTFRAAINDANSNTTNNADVSKENAVAAIYTDNNGTRVVVLLNDTKENGVINISADMNINLGGHTIEFTVADAYLHIETAEKITIDGTIAGSGISKKISAATSGSQFLIYAANTDLTINGGRYSTNNTYDNFTINSLDSRLQLNNCEIASESLGSCISIQARGDIELKNCKITTKGQIQSVSGARLVGNAKVTNCDIISTSSTMGISIYGLNISADAIITDCTIKADGYGDVRIDGTDNYNSYGVAAIKCDSSSSITINDGNYFGVREALSVRGIVRINGGIFEGCQHGGAYMSGVDIKVKNATFRNVIYTGNCGWNATHFGAVYCGGSQVSAKVEFDNCSFESEGSVAWGVVAKYTDTKVYLSNSKISDKFTGNHLRADNGNVIFVGKNVSYRTDKIQGNIDTTTYANEEFGNW